MSLLIFSFAITMVWVLAHFLRPEGLPTEAHYFFAAYAGVCWFFWLVLKIMEHYSKDHEDKEEE